ncbi:MAG: TonB-dependent receptor [Acidobacteria bacterium]|nr:TonB-dependent receptor [Acidobacteriota bacterium]
MNLGTFLLLIAMALPLRAQLSFASINGTVRDATGAVVPAAEVVLKNLQTGVEKRTQTNENGIYVVLNILPGSYTLAVAKEGFSTSRLDQFDLVVNQSSVFDFALATGKVQDSITVEAVGAQVQNATAELGSVLTTKQVVDLPSGRNIQNLMRLTPGVTAVATGQSSIPSVNGQINRSSMYMLDGASNQSTFFSNLALNPIMETVEEFKVQSHNDSAEFGGVMGGIINTATKSGTNELHGQVWHIVQNDAFNARNTFNAAVNPLKVHTFGGVAGGPVWVPKVYNGRNRTFFFFGYQYTQNHSPALSYFRVPTPANLNGDLSDWPKQIYNPLTTRANPAQAGTFLRDPFPRNQIPVSMMNPGMVYFAKTVLPAPEPTPVADRNAINRAPNTSHSQTFNIRGDHQFSTRDTLTGRYTGTFSPGKAAINIPAMARASEARAVNVTASWVHTFGPSAMLQSQFGRVVQWAESYDQYKSLPSDFTSKVGYSSNVLTPYSNGLKLIPGLNVANYYSSSENFTHQVNSDSYLGKVNFSKLFRSHNFKMGGEYTRVGWNSVIETSGVGFADAQTADPTRLGQTGGSLASFLLGIPDSATRRDIVESMPRFAGVMGFYFQDSWKASSNLTINLGLRYDRTFTPAAGTEKYNNNKIGDMDYQTGTYILQATAPPCSQVGKYPCIPTPAGAAAGWLPANVRVSPNGKILQDTTLNFQPRLGLAYRMGPKTAIRASSGIFFDNYSGVTQIARNPIGTWPSLGFQSAANLNYPTATQVLPSVPATNPLPSASLPLADPFAQSAYFFDPNWKNAYSLQWNIGVQRQIGSRILTTVNYVGSGSHRTDVGGRYGMAVRPGPGNFRERMPFPYMSVPVSWDRSWGNSNYHGLQTSLERRFGNGLAFTATYTYSKAIDPGSSGFFGVEGNSIQNPYDMHADRSISSYDVTHNSVLSWVYDLPFGKGKAIQSGNRIVDYITGNWQVNGIADLRSGVPVNVTVAGDIANTGNVNYMRPDVVGDWRIDNPTPQRWFNTAAFKAPAAFTFGSAGRNILRSQSVHRFDMSAFRKFPIRERIYAEFRAEAYNVLNTVTYNAPVADVSNINFGRVLGAAASRSMQLSARIHF